MKVGGGPHYPSVEVNANPARSPSPVDGQARHAMNRLTDRVAALETTVRRLDEENGRLFAEARRLRAAQKK